MKATGIVRRIDDLGRVVIPKGIRRSMGIREGDPLEMYIDNESGGLVLVAYHSGAVTQLRAVAENISTVGSTPEHWKLAEEIHKIAKKLEKLD